MPKFRVTVADEAGQTLYDETIEATGPLEACAKAVSDAQTAEVSEPDQPNDPLHPPGGSSEAPATL